LTPPNDALGVLQDTHWADGYFGYFSTYALGNLVSAQLWEVINVDIPDLSAQVKTGEFSTILEWLRENVHAHGRKFEPRELVKRITGDKINPAAYMRYLKKKFGELYNI
jgi:carboxypeptidase Taq